MPAGAANRHGNHLRQRGTSALVLSRSDTNADPPAAPLPHPPSHAAQVRRRLWPAVVTWILLGGAIAALWALLLLGDSRAGSR